MISNLNPRVCRVAQPCVDHSEKALGFIASLSVLNHYTITEDTTVYGFIPLLHRWSMHGWALWEWGVAKKWSKKKWRHNMRATEISCHRLQEIKLLLKLHIQLASIDEIIWLTINMPFGPVGYQHEVMADKHSETYGNYKENKQDLWNKPIHHLETWLIKQWHDLRGKDFEAKAQKEINLALDPL